MGQTLTHGIYLPDEGERNCYDGLASNWSILDGAVGTVAEHTTALAGKAPAVHTHTKSDITDFPAYGTTAGTICEGNDSRLSDARTPVAHTHTKSDVTDLLNSNFIPSANNSYNLGSSSYQWNNLYAKNYYYNGTAWGLDKENAWSGNNRFYKSVSLSEVALPADCTLGFTGLNTVIFYNTRGSSNVPSYGTFCYIGYSNTSPYRGGMIKMVRSTDKRGETNDGYVPDTSFNLWQLQVTNKFFDFMEAVRVTNNGNENSLKPITTNTTDLGTSANKWKSFNGINPGALSLPDLSVSQNIDTNGWVYNGTTLNSVLLNTGDTVVTKNGWLYVRINNTVAGDRLAVRLNNEFAEYPTAIVGEIGFGHIEIFVPLVAGYKAYVFTNKAPTYIKFYPCLGNVPSGV